MADYKVMKDGSEIKTCKSLSSAKKAAVSAGAEVFCDGKRVYPETETPVSTKIYQLKALMNVREKPDLSAKVLTTMKTGTKVTVLEIKDDWLKIVFNEGDAYVLYGSGKFAQEGE